MINDRTAGVLEKYDIRVLRLQKGRGSVLCETDTGMKILKEYKGSSGKLLLQNSLLQEIKNKGYVHIEQLIFSKEGEPVVKEEDGTVYYLKDYSVGKECNIRDHKDCLTAMTCLARLHCAMNLKGLAALPEIPVCNIVAEWEKQNRELRKIKKYLKQKKQKTEFEYYLLSNFDPFLERAELVLKGVKEDKGVSDIENIRLSGSFCHGDMQHHNLLFTEDTEYFINFEKFILDSPARDITLLFRKIMEKNNWSEQVGNRILEAYEKVRPLTGEEKKQIYFRLSYPEKFRKICNFYFNSTKAWIPDKNREKLDKILQQETERARFLEEWLHIDKW